MILRLSNWHYAGPSSCVSLHYASSLPAAFHLHDKVTWHTIIRQVISRRPSCPQSIPAIRTPSTVIEECVARSSPFPQATGRCLLNSMLDIYDGSCSCSLTIARAVPLHAFSLHLSHSPTVSTSALIVAIEPLKFLNAHHASTSSF